MTIPLTDSQIERLRRDAKLAARRDSVPHHVALDRVAVEHGFANWSLLMHACSAADAAPETTPAVDLTAPLAQLAAELALTPSATALAQFLLKASGGAERGRTDVERLFACLPLDPEDAGKEFSAEGKRITARLALVELSEVQRKRSTSYGGMSYLLLNSFAISSPDGQVQFEFSEHLIAELRSRAHSAAPVDLFS